MSSTVVYKTSSETETFAFGESIGRNLRHGMNVLFYGNLGAGKTAMIRGICHALGVDVSLVNSPTFTIVNEYSGNDVRVFHIDAYRLTANDFVMGGFDEYLTMDGCVCLIEWAENIGEISGDIIVKIDGSGEEERSINVISLP